MSIEVKVDDNTSVLISIKPTNQPPQTVVNNTQPVIIVKINQGQKGNVGDDGEGVNNIETVTITTDTDYDPLNVGKIHIWAGATPATLTIKEGDLAQGDLFFLENLPGIVTTSFLTIQVEQAVTPTAMTLNGTDDGSVELIIGPLTGAEVRGLDVAGLDVRVRGNVV